LIRKLFETYATGGYTLDQLCRFAHEWKLMSRSKGKLALAMIHRMLQNPFYYGLVTYKDESSQGVHVPLVSKELFDTVQAAIKRRGKPNKYKKHHFPLTGLATCGSCSGAITAERQKGHHYYRCTKKFGPCSEKYVREEVLGQQIKKALQKIALPDDSFAEAYDALGQMTRKASQPVAQLKFELDKQLPLLKVKQDRLLNAHLEGLIDKAEYRKTKTYLINKEMDLRTKLTNLEKGATGWLEPAQNFLRTAHSVGKLLASDAHLIEQKDFLKKTGSNFRVGGRRLSFSAASERLFFVSKRFWIRMVPFREWVLNFERR